MYHTIEHFVIVDDQILVNSNHHCYVSYAVSYDIPRMIQIVAACDDPRESPFGFQHSQ